MTVDNIFKKIGESGAILNDMNQQESYTPRGGPNKKAVILVIELFCPFF